MEDVGWGLRVEKEEVHIQSIILREKTMGELLSGDDASAHKLFPLVACLREKHLTTLVGAVLKKGVCSQVAAAETTIDIGLDGNTEKGMRIGEQGRGESSDSVLLSNAWYSQAGPLPRAAGEWEQGGGEREAERALWPCQELPLRRLRLPTGVSSLWRLDLDDWAPRSKTSPALPVLRAGGGGGGWGRAVLFTVIGISPF